MPATTMLLTQATDFRRARITNCTDTSFDSVVPSTTKPIPDAAAGSATARAAIDVLGDPDSNGPVPNSVLIVPFGEGADDTTFVMRVVGFRRVKQDGKLDLWVPVKLGEFTCTHCTAVGVAGAAAVATDRFVDTIVRVTGAGNDVSSEIVSPADNTIGHILLDLKGCQLWEPVFDMTGATAGNCLYAYL